MPEQTWRNTSINMVHQVRSIIDGYRMGSNRALAQDPVQNSLDALAHEPVRVEYRLHRRPGHNGGEMVLLTVTDSNTTGLRGAPLTSEQLQARAGETGMMQLNQDENWAAWEAMGYTKTGEEDLGSRGQGKAAFLYHSAHDTGYVANGIAVERMVILYDTLLEDGTYRFGARLARPDDVVITPPLEGSAAMEAVASTWQLPHTELAIALDLEPLRQPGTRVIVPFLLPATVAAFERGDMQRWLQVCWWRAIQTRKLEIAVGWEGSELKDIEVPAWWAGEPWRHDGDRCAVDENILVGGTGLKIKRIVLMHDPQLESSEIDAGEPEFAGVQLLRGSGLRGAQWIETVGVRERLGDYIPPNHRPGFRGFVEFERQLDIEMKRYESPQHDRFSRRPGLVQSIDRIIEEHVKAYADRMGWTTPEESQDRADDRPRDMLEKVADIFMTNRAGSRSANVRWSADFEVGAFPTPGSTRVDWGQTLHGIASEVRHTPADARRELEAEFFIVGPDGVRTGIETHSRLTAGGTASVELGDRDVVKISRHVDQLPCPAPGKYRIGVEWREGGKRVAAASQFLHVRVEPVTPPVRPLSAALSVELPDPDRRRVNHGESIDVVLRISSRGSEPVDAGIAMSLGGLSLASERINIVHLPGIPAGGTPATLEYRVEGVRVFTHMPDAPLLERDVVLETGKHRVEADIWSGDPSLPVVHATAELLVNIDPAGAGGGAPFNVIAFEDSTLPRRPLWVLERPAATNDPWVLKYSPRHPKYEGAEAADRLAAGRRATGSSFYGTAAFWAETHCSALIEWALVQYVEQGSESQFQLITGEEPDTDDRALWEAYNSAVHDLLSGYGDSLACFQLKRQVLSSMLRLVEHEGVG